MRMCSFQNPLEMEMQKRKSAFVRFGRSDGGVQKRKSSYVRFGWHWEKINQHKHLLRFIIRLEDNSIEFFFLQFQLQHFFLQSFLTSYSSISKFIHSAQMSLWKNMSQSYYRGFFIRSRWKRYSFLLIPLVRLHSILNIFEAGKNNHDKDFGSLTPLCMSTQHDRKEIFDLRSIESPATISGTKKRVFQNWNYNSYHEGSYHP